MLILLAWLASLVRLLLAEPLRGPAGLVLLAVALRTFLQTGLFVLGHDAMHRTLVPGHRRLNDGLGRLALLLYAALPCGRCRRHHLRHHRCPGSQRDPDFRSSPGDGVVLWYARFMGNYLSAAQLAPLLVAWALAVLVLAGRRPGAADQSARLLDPAPGAEFLSALSIRNLPPPSPAMHPRTVIVMT